MNCNTRMRKIIYTALLVQRLSEVTEEKSSALLADDNGFGLDVLR